MFANLLKPVEKPGAMETDAVTGIDVGRVEFFKLFDAPAHLLGVGVYGREIHFTCLFAPQEGVAGNQTPRLGVIITAAVP